MQQPIKKPRPEVREEKMHGVDSLMDKMVMVAIERHPVMVPENEMDGCLPCQDSSAQNRETFWRWNGTGAPPADPVAPPPGTPPPPLIPQTPLGDTDRNDSYEMDGLPSTCVYMMS
jgi:hypothetical protein